MPTWGEILRELALPENRNVADPQGRPDYDKVRRKYLVDMYRVTSRPVILYASAFTTRSNFPANAISVELGDKLGFMETVGGLPRGELDLILHSPGGSAEAAESIMDYLRTRFSHIRAFVPFAAMSAATMMALCSDEIVMGRHSQLGPIDPQVTIHTPEGPRSAPAKAILDQFEKAKQDAATNPPSLGAWLPILRSFAPGLLTVCENQRNLAEAMVRSRLQQYMFAGDKDAEAKARGVAAWFADYDNFGSHGRSVGLDLAAERGLKVTALEESQTLQDAVLSVFHATAHTFAGTSVAKIIENHEGRAYVTTADVIELRVPNPIAPVPPPQQPNRAERRRQSRP